MQLAPSPCPVSGPSISLGREATLHPRSWEECITPRVNVEHSLRPAVSMLSHPTSLWEKTSGVS